METRTCGRCFNLFQTTGSVNLCSLCYNAKQAEDREWHFRPTKTSVSEYGSPSPYANVYLFFIFLPFIGVLTFGFGLLISSKIIMYIGGVIIAAYAGLILHVFLGLAYMTADFDKGLSHLLEYFSFVFGNFPT